MDNRFQESRQIEQIPIRRSLHRPVRDMHLVQVLCDWSQVTAPHALNIARKNSTRKTPYNAFLPESEHSDYVLPVLDPTFLPHEWLLSQGSKHRRLHAGARTRLRAVVCDHVIHRPRRPLTVGSSYLSPKRCCLAFAMRVPVSVTRSKSSFLHSTSAPEKLTLRPRNVASA